MPNVYWNTLTGPNPEVIDPDIIPYSFGPILQDYYARAISHVERLQLIRDVLYKIQMVPVTKYRNNAQFFPGSTIGGQVGPKPATVMIVGRIPGRRPTTIRLQPKPGESLDVRPIDYLLGDGSMDVLLSAFDEVGITPEMYNDFYVTNMVRFPRLTEGNKGVIQTAWVKEGLHFLHQELRLVKPKIILCLGSESSKYFTKYAVTKALSHVFDYEIEGVGKAKVICSLDPRSVLERFESRPIFAAGIKLFADVFLNKRRETFDQQYFYVDNEEQLKAVVDTLIQYGHNTFAVDCEWGGGHFMDSNAGLLTVQIAWSATEAVVVILRRQGMKEVFTPYLTSAMHQLRRLLCRSGVKVIGHNLMSDFPWLYDQGIDLTEQLYFDTMIAAHIFEPLASHKLEDLTVRFVPGWPKHDMQLSDWKKEHPIKEGDGFGGVPDEILHPYGANDACATFRLYLYYSEKLRQPEHQGLQRLFNEFCMPVLPVFSEIEMNGVHMDLERLEQLEALYRERYDTLVAEFRATIDDPEFNPNSARNKSELLFKKLKLTPVKETGKYPMMWSQVLAKGEESMHEPSTDGETLDILSHKSPIVAQLRDICLLKTVLQNFLPPKELDEATGVWARNGGLFGGIKRDGRLRTTIGQMVKTGRLSSSHPNLQNMPNKKEESIAKVLGDAGHKLRTGFKAAPGHLLIISDFKQAEVATTAYLSGDKTLIQAVESGEDVHSVVGRKMFKLEHLTNEEFKTKHKALRVAAKSIVFGLIYGRGPIAIAREVEKAGVECPVDKAEKFIADFFAQFPLVKSLIDSTHIEVMERGWVETLNGRREYFDKAGDLDKKIEARQKRMAFNFKIQGYVADLLRRSLINLKDYRRECPDVPYKLVLTVYDSIMVEAPIRSVEQVADVIMPECMIKRARAPKLGFSIAIDTEVSERWDEAMYYDDMVELGLSQDFAKRYCILDKEGQPLKKGA